MKVLSNLDIARNQLLNLRLQQLSSAPSSPVEGLAYYDTTIHAPFIYDGTDWVNAFAEAGAPDWTDITGTPTTLAGYGITDAATAASPTFTGVPVAPTASGGTNTTQIATTAYVRGEITSLIAGAPAALDTLDELAAALADDANYASTLTTALATKAPLASPTFTGVPAGPTASPGTNTTQLATTAYVEAAVGGTGVVHKYATDVGDNSATSFTVTHSLGTRDVIVQVFEKATPYAQVFPDVAVTTTSAATLTFAAAPTSAQYRCVVTG